MKPATPDAPDVTAFVDRPGGDRSRRADGHPPGRVAFAKAELRTTTRASPWRESFRQKAAMPFCTRPSLHLSEENRMRCRMLPPLAIAFTTGWSCGRLRCPTGKFTAPPWTASFVRRVHAQQIGRGAAFGAGSSSYVSVTVVRRRSHPHSPRSLPVEGWDYIIGSAAVAIFGSACEDLKKETALTAGIRNGCPN